MKLMRFAVQNVTKSQLSDPATQARFEDLYSHYSGMRSEIIDAALYLENKLTAVLLHALVGVDYSRHELLRAFVFEAEFCSFMQKRKMLSMLFETFQQQLPCVTEAEAKALRREINEIIETRNIFAHGHIVIDAITDKVFIKHYQSGPKETEASVTILDEYIRKCERSGQTLHKINEFIKTVRLELPKS